MALQKTHYNTKFKSKSFRITLIADRLSLASNVGGLFRIADAFGVEQLIFCGEATPLDKRYKKTSRSTENYVKFDTAKNLLALIENLKAQQYRITALEITNNSQALHNFSLTSEQPIALIVGNENFGIQESVLKQCDTAIHINMFGQNSSMNVVQAASIALYELTKQLQTLV